MTEGRIRRRDPVGRRFAIADAEVFTVVRLGMS